MMAGGLSLGLAVVGLEHQFSIPENSTLSGVLGAAAVGVFSLLWSVLLLKKPRWILTHEAQQKLAEPKQPQSNSPFSEIKPFES